MADKMNNGGPLSGLPGYLSEIDRQDDELDILRADYMAACKGPRSHIKEIMISAREAGVNMPALRELVRAHRDERKHQTRLAMLEADDAAAFEEMEAALGEFGATPLGEAALAAAKAGGRRRRGRPRKDEQADIDDFRG